LLRELEKAGFHDRGGKARITISGKLGDDAKPYQEQELMQKIKEATR
jgi:hypothetical protein